MTNQEKKIQWIKKLTFMHQYILPGAAVVIPIIIAVFFSENIQNGFFFWLAVCALLYGAYTICGYLLGWKHIFCAYQKMHNLRMTPDAADFEPDVKKGVLKNAGMNLLMGMLLLALLKL